MPCRTIDLGRGGYAIICSRGRREKRCSICKAHVGVKLCDGPGSAPGKTCDAPLCACCAVTRPDPTNKRDTIDYCPKCAPARQPVGGP